MRKKLSLIAASMTLALLSGCSGHNHYDHLSTTDIEVPSATSATHAASSQVSAEAVSSQRVSSLHASDQNTGLEHAPKFAIAFGGGAARGMMHLGVIKALEEAGIKADLVTGTSVGSIAAVMYSAKTYPEIERTLYEFSEHEITDFQIAKNGLIKGKALANWINKQLEVDDITQLPIPTGVVATNLTTKKAVMFTAGNIGQIVQTSSTVPGVFVPVEHQEQWLVDGGVVSPVPVYAARQLDADIVLAIDVFCSQPPPLSERAVDVMANTYWLQSCESSRAETNSADIVIRPQPSDPSLVNFGDKQEREAAMRAGYQAMKAQIPHLKALLASKPAATNSVKI